MTRSWLQHLSRAALRLAGLAAAFAAAGDGQAQSQRQVSIRPYIDIEQSISADFNGGETLSYTGVGGGIDASIQTRRVQATVSYDYQHQFADSGHARDNNVQDGLAAAHVNVTRAIALDAGGIITRGQDDINRPIADVKTADQLGSAKVYGIYGGPSLATHVGALAINGNYNIGYVHVDDQGNDVSPPGTPRTPLYDSSTVQQAQASIGMDTHQSAIGWTVGAGWNHEDMNQLKSRYDDRYVDGSVVVPLAPTFAVTGSVGYEKIKGSEQDFVKDSLGQPVLTQNGNLIGDPSAKRLLTVNTDGLIWDVGVIWRPSDRTELQARGGRRYGSTTVTGTFEHKFNKNYAFSAYIYDNVSSFGRLLIADLHQVPTNFQTASAGRGLNGLTGIGGCVFGVDPGSGACFDSALQSLNNFNFRNRGGGILFSGGRGPWTFGIGAGYANHRYLGQPGDTFLLGGVTEQSFSVEGSLQRKLSRTSGLDFDAYADWYESGITGIPNSSSVGLTGTYYRSLFAERLQADVSAGVYNTHGDHLDSTFGSLLLGMRYTF